MTEPMLSVSPAPAADDGARLRQCGRCRASHPDDETDRPLAQPPEWWLCPPCRLALLGHA